MAGTVRFISALPRTEPGSRFFQRVISGVTSVRREVANLQTFDP